MRHSWAVKALINEGVLTAEPGSYVCFLTLTEPSDARGFEQHSEAVGRFLEDLRVLQWRAHGSPGSSVTPLPYIGVAELQKRGAWHTHLLIKDWRLLQRDQMLALLDRHGLGHSFNFKARKVTPGNVEGFARYMTKTLGGYMVKAHAGSTREAALAALPSGKRLVRSSRAWAEGKSLSSLKRERLKVLRKRVAAERHAAWCDCGAPESHVSAADLEKVVLESLQEMGLVYVAEPDPPPEVVQAGLFVA